jgi:polyhydroxybutyrate depolymerase
VVVSPAPTTAAPAPGQDTITVVDGINGLRNALVHLPPKPWPTKPPLLIALHGSGTEPYAFSETVQFNELADRYGFAVAYPFGVGVTVVDVPDPFRSWNAGSCCPFANDDGYDDVGFIAALVAQLLATEGVDPARVYLTGHSNGAMLAHRLACEQSETFAAIASVAGSITAPSCRPRRAVPVLEIHGTADVSVPFGSGGLPSGVGAVDRWRALDQCDSTATVSNDGPITTSDWSCADGSAVRLVAIEGAPHPWPHEPVLDASATVWEFVSQFRLN